MSINQAFYNSLGTMCIMENTLVRIFEDNIEQYVPVQNIRKGTCVLNNTTSSFVRCVIKTKYNGSICVNNDINIIGITPYHPVRYFDNEWVFPNDREDFVKIPLDDIYVYNFFLENGHEIQFANGMSAVTLNHGLKGPVIGHEYFGTNRVEHDYHSHPGWNNGYICIENIKAIRDKNTGQVIGLEF
jgi:hypothetical protein